MEALVEKLAQAVANSPWGYVAALLAGLLASLSPCALAVVPLAVGYVGGYAGGNRRKVFLSALAFVGGLTVAFTALGFVAGQLGYLWLAGPWGRVLLGLMVSVLGLHFAGVVTLHVRVADPRVSQNSGLVGGFLLGAALGTVSSPCATPALMAILALGATTASPWQAAGLMAAYAVGHWATIFVAALAAGHLPSILEGWGVRTKAATLMRVMGLVLFGAGVRMLTEALARLL